MNHSELINEYKNAIKRCEDTSTLLRLCDSEYEQMYHYYYETDVKGQMRICEIIDSVILPKLLSAKCTTRQAKRKYDLYMNFLALSARRNLKNFAFYIESGKNRKVWNRTMGTLESAFFYADSLTSDMLELLRVSCMPGLGKSYFGNLFVAQLIGIDPNIQILRVTYSDDLVMTTTRQTTQIINSKEFRDIFPRYKEFPDEQIFKSSTAKSFCIADCEDSYNLFAVTREGQASGKRAKYLILDDLLKGESESGSVDLHTQLLDRYDSDWTSRADDDDQKVLILGTMWADTDLLNKIKERFERKSELVPSSRYKFTEITSDGLAVFIGIPALDENEKSTCESRFNTEKLLKRRDEMSEPLWRAVYQQDPLPPTGRGFSYDTLIQYDELPLVDEKGHKIQYSRKASLDPARKGKNFVSVPIFYEHECKHYLVDCLFRKESMKGLYRPIAKLIIKHRVTSIIVEINIDTSLPELLRRELIELGYRGCKIEEIYSTKNKETRIKDAQTTVRENIMFPNKGKCGEGTEMGMLMNNITSFSFEKPNKYDDGIDSVCIYTDEYVEQEEMFASIETYSRRRLGF